ncbi:MAG: hypothetical protein JWM68_1109 [Verrucomicrobiales bacterium]|nr:hypothetical protein [Verrucomicrobiales bacterium]
MKLFSRFSLVMLGSLALAVFRAEAIETAAQPVYHNRPLSYWVDVLDLKFCESYQAALSASVLSSSSWDSSPPIPKVADIPNGPEAQDAIRNAGTNAIPFLLMWLTQTNFPNVPYLGIEESFRTLGSAARPFLPELARMAMATNEVKEDKGDLFFLPRINLGDGASGALDALGWIGPDALPVLVSILTNDFPNGTKVSAIYAIGSMGTNAAPAIPALVTCTEDNDFWIAHAAVMTVGVVGPEDPRVIAALRAIELKPKPKLQDWRGPLSEPQSSCPRCRGAAANR